MVYTRKLTTPLLTKAPAPILSNLAPSDRLDDIVLHPPTHYQSSCKAANDVSINILESVTTLGEHELSFCLGNGGMGSVYRARSTTTGEAVAIKVGGVVGPRASMRWHQQGYMLYWIDSDNQETRPPQWSASYDCLTGANSKTPTWHPADACPHCCITTTPQTTLSEQDAAASIHTTTTTAWNPDNDVMFCTFRREVEVYKDIAHKQHAILDHTPCNQGPPPVTTPGAPMCKGHCDTSGEHTSSSNEDEQLITPVPKRRRVDAGDTYNCGLPRLYAAGFVTTHFGVLPWMALQLLNGNSLADVLLQQQPSSCRDEFVSYAHRMLGCVQMLHDFGWIHRDVKLAQFCNGLGPDRGKLYLVDLGFAIPVDTARTRPRMAFSGTYCYGSSAALWGATPGRRDDLESLVWSLLELWWGQLPWMCASQLTRPTAEDVKNMVHVRNGAMLQARIEGLVPDWALRMFAYLDRLSATDCPDYAHMHQCIAGCTSEVLSAPVMPHNWAEKRRVGTFDRVHGCTAEE